MTIEELIKTLQDIQEDEPGVEVKVSDPDYGSRGLYLPIEVSIMRPMSLFGVGGQKVVLL